MAAPYLDHLCARTSQAQGVLLVAEVKGRLAGYGACWIEHDESVAETPDSNRSGYVADTYVAPPFRRRGIAGALLRSMEEHFRNTDVRRLRIGSLSNNSSALRAYQKHGFGPYETVLEKKSLDGRHGAKH